MDEKQKQVADQCRAVAHMATALAQVHSDYAKMFEAGGPVLNLTETVGKRTAHFMETLGDWLNGMDAVTQEDEFMAPIFREAQRLWPTQR